MTQKFIQARKSTLAGSGVTATDTSIELAEFVTPQGTAIVSGDLGTTNYAVIEPGTTRAEIISFTGLTGTTLTGVTRGLKPTSPYTADSSLRQAHAGGSVLVITNAPQLYEDLVSFNNDETVTGTWTFTNPNFPKIDDATTAPTADEQFVPKKYVDDIALGGSANINRISVAATAGATVADGNVVYLDETDNEWKLADATAAATSENVQLGVAQGAGTDGNGISGGVLLIGRDDAQSGFAAGDPVFISDTAGTLTNTAGTKSVQVGTAVSATEIDFTPSYYKSVATADEKDAMAGTSGTPSTSNKFVTADDATADTTASKIVRRDASGDIPGVGTTIATLTAGETINGATLPVACYLDSADNEWKACDADDQAKLFFQGFAVTNGTDGNDIDIQTQGIVPGFSGLTPGAEYFVQDDQTIGTSVGTYEVYVGVAVSATQVYIDKGTRSAYQYMGSDTFSSGSETNFAATGTATSPAGARFCIYEATLSGAGTFTVNMSIAAIGANSNISDVRYYSTDSQTTNASWSGTTLTVSLSTQSNNGSARSASGTAYFYR